MKPDKQLVAVAGIALAAVCLIGLTWVETIQAIDAQRAENMDRVTATLSNQASSFADEIDRQILGLDRTLQILGAAWKTDPQQFNLKSWRSQAVVLDGLSQDIVLADKQGIVRQSSITDAVNENVSGLDYFMAFADPSAAGEGLYIGPPSIDRIMRQWHMNVARALHNPDRSLAGVISTDYRIASITALFSRTGLDAGSFVTLAGLDDGKTRGSVGTTTIDSDLYIAGTPMFAAMRASNSGIWIGPSANDAMPRIHAFRHIPDRGLVVVVAVNEDEALRPAIVWRRQAAASAGCMTILLTCMAALLTHNVLRARRREVLLAADSARLACSNAQLETARALATAKAEHLQATLTGMSDGVSMIDADLCLVEWNARFPEIAGVPAGILRVGMPMADILRAQVRNGQFGWIADPEAEVERRLARMRSAPFGVAQRSRPDGRVIELRRNRLPDGGFVTLYADITEHKAAEDALRKAQAAAEAANAEKSRFVTIVSHEIRTPLSALLNTIRLLNDSDLAPAQRSLLAVAQQSGDALSSLIGDILDMSEMEGGTLAIRLSVFALRPLLEGCVEIFVGQAAKRGIKIEVAIAPNTPALLLTDPGRLRQVQLNLLSNAVKYGRPGQVWLIAEPGLDGQDAVRISVKDEAPPIAAEVGARLFQPFVRLGHDRDDDDAVTETGLGLSICHYLITLMGGKIGCEIWQADPEPIQDGRVESPAAAPRAGNIVWVTLPLTALSIESMNAVTPGEPTTTLNAEPCDPSVASKRHGLPRTRILLVEDVRANQLVTATSLRCEGHHVEIACNGREAIQAMRATPFDLVFMDIFMPSIGGLEATQMIRALPEPARSTPIIALTASVTPEDAAVFRTAGMNGMLGKPASLAAFLEVMRTYVWQVRGTSAWVEVDADAKTPDVPTAVLSVARIRELRANLAPSTFTHLMEECLVDMEQQILVLKRALVAGVPSEIRLHAHAMAGMAAGYGLAALEVRLRRVMSAADDGARLELNPLIVLDIEQDMQQAVRCVRDLLRTEMA